MKLLKEQIRQLNDEIILSCYTVIIVAVTIYVLAWMLSKMYDELKQLKGKFWN